MDAQEDGWDIPWHGQQERLQILMRADHLSRDTTGDMIYHFVVMHKLNDMFSFSFNWTYGSGAYTTLPVGRYVYQNESGTAARSVVPIYEGRNNYRLQPVHRLDINFVTTLRSKKSSSRILHSAYIMFYSRRNPFYMQFKEVTDKEGYITSFLPKVVSLFPVLPALLIILNSDHESSVV